MTAYELADELDGRLDHKAANMLRQQADRIAELEKLLEHSVGSDCREMRYIQEIENKDARIAELEKVIKEAVKAFDDASDGAGVNFYAYAEEWKTKLSSTTPQTKPLSDEEIKEVWMKRPANTAEDVVRFARAIEERHGIKNE